MTGEKIVKTNLPLSTYRRLLAAYLGPQRRQVVALAGLLFGGLALQLANPQIIRHFLDATQAGAGANGELALAGLAFIGLGLLQTAANWAAVYVGENVSWAATNALRRDLTRHTLRLDLPFHKQHTPGELIERIDGDAAALGNFFSQFTLRLLSSGLLVAGILVLLFAEDWRLGLGLSVYAGLTLAALAALQGVAVPRWARLRQAEAELAGYVEERYNATEDIRGVGAEAAALAGLDRLTAGLTNSGVAAQFSAALSGSATAALYLAGYVIGLALGAYLYLHGAVSLGGAYVVIYYVGLLAAPLETMRSQMQDLGQARATLGRIAWLFRQESALAGQAHAALPAGALAVALHDVHFFYRDAPEANEARQPARPGFSAAGRADGEAAAARSEGAPRAGWQPALPEVSVTGAADGGEAAAETAGEPAGFSLAGVSFALAAGRVLGILGRTGSGKTTVSSLLFRLYDPGGGSVRLGGIDLRHLAADDLRGRVGLITQDVQLFQASIRDNLAFFNPRRDDGEIAAALAELGLWSWVQAMPAGLDTLLGAGGRGLSAGEAQLLAFARVFLKDPGLVVLDEASARLDPATERLLEGAVDRLLVGRTGIIIAHRLATVRRADDILILERGRVVEYGPRLALAADPRSRFTGLLRTGLEEALV